MAIDDPLSKELQCLEEEIDADSSLARLATTLGLSAATIAIFHAHPIISQILTSLLTVNPKRFEQRLLTVMKALADQQRQIQNKIPDENYYKSEEFHALLLLILERLHSTHQKEKLKTFGEALANSGKKDSRQMTKRCISGRFATLVSKT